MITTIIIVITCILLEGFFSGSEIALISSDKLKIRHMAEKGNWFAKQIQDMLSKPDKVLGTTLAGTNISAIIGSVVMTSYLVSKFGDNGALYSIIIMFPLILVCGEIIPKILFQRNADSISPVIIIPIKIFSLLLSPLLFIMTRFSDLIFAIFLNNENTAPAVKKDELKSMIEGDKSNVDLNKSEREMIRKIFDFGDTTVREVMTPLVELVAVELNSSVNSLIKKAKTEEYSRIPIYEGRIYNIVGVVNIFDLLFLEDKDNISISDIMKPVYYVPWSKRADDLLNELQASGNHLSIVVNEYGGGIGVVTIEDILEEIVGEIEDEYDYREEMYERIDKRSFMIDARMEVDAINEQLPLNIPKGDYETLAGFILERLEKIPKKGDILTIKDLTLRIEDADNIGIKSVFVTLGGKKIDKTKH